MSKNKTFFVAVGIILFYFISLGWILPFLLSAESDLLAIVGVIYLILVLYLTYMFILKGIDFVKAKIKQNKKNEN